MEVALRTPEILDLVFQHLRFTDELTTSVDARSSLPFTARWRKNKASLLNAALACRAFFVPAMSNLWWRVNGIMPFIKLLPSATLKNTPRVEYDYVTTSREWILEEELDEKALERFDFYARMVVQILDMGRKSEENITALLIQLAEVRPSKVCFPKLRSFKAYYYNPDPWLFYTSPTLNELLLIATNWSDDKFKTMTSMVGRLPTRSPELQVLQIPFIPNQRSLGALVQLQALRELTLVGSVPAQSVPLPALLTSLSTLPRLEKLDIFCPHPMSDEDFLTAPVESSTETWYPELTSIALTGDVTTNHQVIQYFLPKALKEVKLRLLWTERPETANADEIQLLTQAMQPFASTLKSFSIKCDLSLDRQTGLFGSLLTPRGFVSVGKDVFTPLFGLSHLEELELDSTLASRELKDPFLLSLAQAWPGLKKLTLPHTMSVDCRTAPFTFSGIQRMAQSLPLLEELSLDFSAVDVPVSGLAALQLKTLDVRMSPIKRKRAAAVTLSRAFPNLETLKYSGDVHNSNLKQQQVWREVAAWLPVLTGRYCSANDDDDDLPLTPPSVRGHHTAVDVYDIMPPGAVGINLGGHDYYSDEDSDDPLGYDEPDDY
ncbi:hypothetical protein D9611_009026 [Ephemerocybe angulata]|uniref:F-box domain-containing protein n=1 Tax=Ephemerocybe angulata TaxID=980116 RepID=A0A8H5FK93_9AGAR|nr:hypothetical protein D9611_009026 [Tulosesus angulatus]